MRNSQRKALRAVPASALEPVINVVDVRDAVIQLGKGPDGGPRVIIIVNGGETGLAFKPADLVRLGAEGIAAAGVARLTETELDGLKALQSPIVQPKPPPLIVPPS